MKKKKSLIFLSIKKGKSFEKGQMHLTITWIEGIPFLRVYLTTFIAKQGTIFKDIRYKQNAQYCSICSSNDLICYLLWQTSHLEDRDHARIAIIYNEVFTYFFFECINCEFSGWGKFSGGQLLQWTIGNNPGGNHPGGNYPGSNFRWGNCPRTFSMNQRV